MNRNDSPPAGSYGRRFYAILGRADGLVDVFLDGKVYPMTDRDGRTDYNIMIYVVRGIDPKDFQPDLETHIREHWGGWKDMAEVIWL